MFRHNTETQYTCDIIMTKMSTYNYTTKCLTTVNSKQNTSNDAYEPVNLGIMSTLHFTASGSFRSGGILWSKWNSRIKRRPGCQGNTRKSWTTGSEWRHRYTRCNGYNRILWTAWKPGCSRLYRVHRRNWNDGTRWVERIFGITRLVFRHETIWTDKGDRFTGASAWSTKDLCGTFKFSRLRHQRTDGGNNKLTTDQ